MSESSSDAVGIGRCVFLYDSPGISNASWIGREKMETRE